MAIQPDLLGGLGIVLGRLQQRKVALQVVIPIFQRRQMLAQIAIGGVLRGIAGAMGGIEGRELAIPDPHRQVPVVPGRIGGGIAGVDPGAILHVYHIGGRDRIGLQILLNPLPLDTGVGIGDITGVLPGATVTGAAGAVVAIMGDDEILGPPQGGSGGFIRLDGRSGHRPLIALFPGARLFDRNTGDLGDGPGFRIDVLHPVRDRGKRELVPGHLLFVEHVQRHPGTHIALVLQIGAVRWRHHGIDSRVVQIGVVLQRPGVVHVAQHRPGDPQLVQHRDQTLGEAQLGGEKPLGGGEAATEEIGLRQRHVLVDQILEEVIIAHQRSHAVVTGEVDGIQRLETIGGLVGLLRRTPVVAPTEIVTILVTQLGETLHVVDHRRRHGDVGLAHRMAAAVAGRRLHRPAQIGALLRVVRIVGLQIVVRHRLGGVGDIEAVTRRRTGLELLDLPVVHVTDLRANGQIVILTDIVVGPEVGHVVVIDMGG